MNFVAAVQNMKDGKCKSIYLSDTPTMILKLGTNNEIVKETRMDITPDMYTSENWVCSRNGEVVFYRLLNDGEVIEEGDEYYDAVYTGKWLPYERPFPSHDTISREMFFEDEEHPYRRRIKGAMNDFK